jgi:hypothetical protein
MLDSRKSEDDFVSWFGSRTPLSGADQTLPGDALGKGAYVDFCGENKFSQKQSRALSLKEIKKIQKEARTYNKDWIFRTDFDFKVKVISMMEATFRRLAESVIELEQNNLSLQKRLNEQIRINNELRVLYENIKRDNSNTTVR